MKISAVTQTIALPRPFRIAHGTSFTRETVLVQIHDEATGLIGRGEGALPPYYPSTAEASLAWINGLASRRGGIAPPEARAGLVAFDIAQQDLIAQMEGRPLWSLLEGSLQNLPPCSRTLSIPADEQELRERLDAGVEHGSTCFKLKSGSGDFAWDRRCLELARHQLPRAHLAVDANAAWSPRQTAQIAPLLRQWEYQYIEQPVAREWEAWRELRQSLSTSAPPLIADESLQGVDDFPSAGRLADGVNIKLLKAGGLTGARAWIDLARSHHLRLMIGVMVETGIGRTAAAQLASFAEWLDIDPPDEIPFAPYSGIGIEGDRLSLSDRPGLGLLPSP